MLKPCLMTICSAVLVVSGMSAQGQAPPPPKPADEGPSLQVTMQFVQEKLKAKLPYWTDITADPANCQITFAKHYDPELSANGNSRDYTTTFSFREVEKIEVMPLREYSRVTGQEEDPDNPPSPDTFVLRVLMTTAKSVHERKTTSKKGKVVSGPANYNANWNYDKYKGEWTATFQEGEDLANRLAKAMAHAVELCGGGSEPEPF